MKLIKIILYFPIERLYELMKYFSVNNALSDLQEVLSFPSDDRTRQFQMPLMIIRTSFVLILFYIKEEFLLLG